MDLRAQPERAAGRRGPRDRSGSEAEMLARLIAEGRISRDIGVTARGKADGAGAQALAVVSAMVLARFAGCRYVHSPFASMAHAPGEPADWAQRWERFLNFGDGEARAPGDATFVPIAAALADPAACGGQSVVIAGRLFALPERKVAAVREGLRGELRAKYRRSPKAGIPSHRAASGLTAAVHLRRGDVNNTRHARRHVGDAAMLRAIARLQTAVTPLGQKLTINLYSEGSAEDFGAFAALGCRLHISADPFESFHNMVTADILMIAPSSFSRLAGLLSGGVVLDHRTHSAGLSNWLRRRRNGDIPVRRIRRALIARMSRAERWRCRIRRWWRRLIS